MTFLSALVALMLAQPLPSPGGGGAYPVPAGGDMVRVPAGSYLPHYSQDRQRVAVAAFELDRYAVTRQDFLAFVTERPGWRRSQVKPLFAAESYLAGWRDDLDMGGAESGRLPVTNVSWFAAKSYCEWQGKRLPTTDEWEYAAIASETVRDASTDPAFLQRLLDLHTGRRAGLPVGSGFRNAHGVWDLHGVVSEWVLDFNNTSVSDDSRAAGGGHDRLLYCAAGGVAATNPSNYAAFLRFATRAGLDGRSTQGSLGFRCARSLP
jgi:formylglycine-generating enzyme